MDNKAWKKLLHENKLNEAVDFLNKPNDGSHMNKVQLTLMRKIDGFTAFYRLEDDGWFRRYENPGKGYGILLKSFKVTGKGKPSSVKSIRIMDYPVILTYVEDQYSTEIDWDTNPDYVEKAKGLLMIFTDRTHADGKEIENFVNHQIRKGTYQP